MEHAATKLADKVLSGPPLSWEDAIHILRAKGAELSLYMANAHRIREQTFGSQIELCSIINAKSGRCPENCAYCAQSIHHSTGISAYPLKSNEDILQGARKAEAEGAYCYGIVTSGTSINEGEELERLLQVIREIKVTTKINPSVSLGILTPSIAQALADAGCVTYHHNLETARSFFPEICSTHDYEEDVKTVNLAKQAGMKVCCGGLFGLGESLEQRVELAFTLRDLDVDSIPLNFLNPIAGTPLENKADLTPMDCLKIIAMFRYVLPDKKINVCGGREKNLRDYQSWIFMAGASGMMTGNYLTTRGRNFHDDMQMIKDGEVNIDG